MYPTIRDVLKYGDVFFVRDPDTFELQKVNIYDVLGVVVDDLKIQHIMLLKMLN